MVWVVQLVLDTNKVDELMIFWGNVLQQPWISSLTTDALRDWRKDYPAYDGRGRIDAPERRHMPVYMQTVPESKAGRNRVRLELAVNDVDEARRTVEGLGATSTGPEGSADEWQDVDGNEFTIAGGLNDPAADRAWRSIVIDCLDPDRMVEFWSQATGYIASDGRCDGPAGSVRMRDGWLEIDGERVAQPSDFFVEDKSDRVHFDLTPGIAFNKVDEPKQHKNRLHLDLISTDAEAQRDRLVGMGASVQTWDEEHVMVDPEGNEFCIG